MARLGWIACGLGACAAATLAPAIAAAGVGDLVISEVMVAPACSDDARGEWFEVYNATASTVDLTGWLAVSGGETTEISGVYVAPGARVVLCGDADPLLNGGVACDHTFAGPLLDTTDRIAVLDGSGDLVDEVSWTGGPWPIAPATSFALRDAAHDAASNDAAAVWCASLDPIPGGCGDFGSPGFPNADVDRDEDGVCDASDGCIDADGDLSGTALVPGACRVDTDDSDPFICHDADADGCDDCATGVDDPRSDGPDADGDGLCDAGDLCDGLDASGDADGDGTCDNLDADDDGDGWPDTTEGTCGTDPDEAGSLPGDEDADGVCDALDACYGVDASGDLDLDGICDNLDNDDDDDGWSDVSEASCGADPDDVLSVPDDSDSDGTCDALDACDGLDASGDADHDGTCDNLDADDDDDGWTDPAEATCGTDSGDPFSVPGDGDGDGTCDALDACDGLDVSGDADGDGTCDSLDDDDDGDLWGDVLEASCGTDPGDPLSVPADADGDGTCDVNDATVCGDGEVAPGEDCDDGATVPGDGCSESCLFEGTPAAAGDVVVTEMMLRPGCSSSNQGEWIELTSTRVDDLLLSYWSVRVQTGATWTISGDLTLPAGGSVVLCADERPAANGGVTCDAEWSGLSLADGAGSVEVLDPSGVLVDGVAWDVAAGWPFADGRSLAAAPGTDAAGNDSPAAWCPSTAPIPGGCGDGGTPGDGNLDEDLDLDGVCDASDACFDADGDGAGDPTWPTHACQDDSDEADPFACNDSDNDGCDDCSGSGFDDPLDDGEDLDEDGICDATDLCDGANPSGDPDGDGTCNDQDDDDDGDGWTDADEAECGTDPVNPADVPTDADANGICDELEAPADSDGDGWSDDDETACGTNPNNPNEHPQDRDGDGYDTCLDADCNDNDAEVHPGAYEVPYNGSDEDCDGADLTDVDGDGWGGGASGGQDCDDTNAAVSPAAAELCDDMVDNDCDSKLDGVDSDCGGGDTPAPDGCGCDATSQRAERGTVAWFALGLLAAARRRRG